MCSSDPAQPQKGSSDPWKSIAIFFGVCSAALLASTIALAVQKNEGAEGRSGLGAPATTEDYVWTKAGLEAIPFEDWREYSGDDGFYVKNFPFPGDDVTDLHLAAAAKGADDLLEMGHIERRDAFALRLTDEEPLPEVPVVFADPIVVEESLIDYRLQFASDIGSNDIGNSAAKGRLVNPAGRRLREHFYRFPDQCDATPIALEVFLRLMM